MSDQPTTREELYERIKNSSKTNVILEEMVRLGFWPRDKPLPKDPDEEIKRRNELDKEYRALGTELSRLGNYEAMKKEFRKRRMEGARKKRAETKERRLRDKKERAERWAVRMKEEILYLGDDVSGGLSRTENDGAKLMAAKLPVFASSLELAEAIGITLNQLRFLAYNRRVSKISHYIRFQIPKRNGSFRTISAPMPHLKAAQHWILNNILYKLSLREPAHGFVPGRSILTNAEKHLKKNIIINIDLKNFFPSVGFKRVKGLFRSFGYSESIAIILALLCTEPDAKQVEMDGEIYHVSQGRRVLPQGAPTSPCITNLICRRMDGRLTKLAGEFDCTYTRYADDLTFSSREDPNIGRLLSKVAYTVKTESFSINKDKTKILRQKKRQEVTGIVVNDKPNICRRKVKRFRAFLYQVEKDGIKGKQWGNSKNVVAAVKGFANYVAMVNPEKGAKLVEQVKRLFPQTKKN